MGLWPHNGRLDRCMNRALFVCETPMIRATNSKDGMNKPNDNTSLEATPATPQYAGGQAALRRRMTIDPDIRNRSITGAVLWAVQATIGAVQQYGPAGATMSRPAFYAYLAVTATMALLCLFVGPRLS